MVPKTSKKQSAVKKAKNSDRKTTKKASVREYDRHRQKENRRAIYWYLLIACQIILLVCLVIKDKDKIFQYEEKVTSVVSSVPVSEPEPKKVQEEKAALSTPLSTPVEKFIPEEELDTGVHDTLPIKETVQIKQPDSVEKAATESFTDAESDKQKKTIPLWERNAVKTSKLPEGTPFIAVIIDDMGIDKQHTKDILDIPAPLTVSFITYASDLEALADHARKSGKEIMLHIPMQPSNPKVDSGPDTLVVQMGKKEISNTVQKTVLPLIKSLKPAGANNHMGSKFTSYQKGMNYFMQDFATTGLYFVDSVTSKDTVTLKTADEFGVPTAPRNVFLDNVDEVDYVMNQLSLLEEAARKQGFAIGIGHPHSSTVQALKIWVDTLDDKGLSLVPTSVIIKKRAQMDKNN